MVTKALQSSVFTRLVFLRNTQMPLNRCLYLVANRSTANISKWLGSRVTGGFKDQCRVTTVRPLTAAELPMYLTLASLQSLFCPRLSSLSWHRPMLGLAVMQIDTLQSLIFHEVDLIPETEDFNARGQRCLDRGHSCIVWSSFLPIPSQSDLPMRPTTVSG